MKRILMSGATGLVGTALADILIGRGDELTVLSQDATRARETIPLASECVTWNYKSNEDYTNHFQLKDAVIHLAGANIFGKRWTEGYKEKIYDSRILTTKKMVDTIAGLEQKPEVFIHASAIGIYGDAGDTILTEKSDTGEDFLSHVCKDWEDEAKRIDEIGVRRVTLRFGIILDHHGGALGKMLPAFRFFVGGHLGNGKQWFSWVHRDEVLQVIIKALDDNSYAGAYNVTSPQPVTMKEFAKSLGDVLNRPSVFPVPKFVLQVVMGQAANAILASQRVLPEKLQSQNYTFTHPVLKEALRDIL